RTRGALARAECQIWYTFCSTHRRDGAPWRCALVAMTEARGRAPQPAREPPDPRRSTMRCDNCGRPIINAELWQLGGDPKAPTGRSMRMLCWDCRKQEEERSTKETERKPAEVSVTQWEPRHA